MDLAMNTAGITSKFFCFVFYFKCYVYILQLGSIEHSSKVTVLKLYFFCPHLAGDIGLACVHPSLIFFFFCNDYHLFVWLTREGTSSPTCMDAFLVILSVYYVLQLCGIDHSSKGCV